MQNINAETRSFVSCPAQFIMRAELITPNKWGQCRLSWVKAILRWKLWFTPVGILRKAFLNMWSSAAHLLAQLCLNLQIYTAAPKGKKREERKINHCSCHICWITVVIVSTQGVGQNQTTLPFGLVLSCFRCSNVFALETGSRMLGGILCFCCA